MFRFEDRFDGRLCAIVKTSLTPCGIGVSLPTLRGERCVFIKHGAATISINLTNAEAEEIARQLTQGA